MSARPLTIFSRRAGFLFLSFAFLFLVVPVARALIIVHILPVPPDPTLDLSLSINGTQIKNGDVVHLPLGTSLSVSIHATEGDADPPALSEFTQQLASTSAFYLDFYKGELFSGAQFVSGEQMNLNSPTLKTSSSVTFSEPGVYSVILYNSQNLRNYFEQCESPTSCSPATPTGLLRWAIGTWPEDGFGTIEPLGRVTFTIADDSCAVPGACASNVLFLPGIEGSRLYEGTGCGNDSEEKLWEPLDTSVLKVLRGAGDKKVKSLFLDKNGESVCGDIYTKKGDILDTVGGNAIYSSLENELDGLKDNGTINDWKPVSYDWRLSLDDLLKNGTERDGKIFYGEASSTPYIEQTLRSLAESSKTGKVTIIAHSNGGLVAKALLAKLGDSEAEKLIDKVIMVGVPQSGAPMSIGALLFGYAQGISWHYVSILSNAVAREFSNNSPMAYHLLPSEDYLESTMGDSGHPVIRFSGVGYAKEEAAYGTTIANRVSLADFLLDKDGGRENPSSDNLKEAKVLNPALIHYANATHAPLDVWMPPAGIEVDQIAGWGVDTLEGIDFYTPSPASVLDFFEPKRAYRPILVEDGDGVVPAPSALLMAENANVKRYWLNLDSYRIATSIKRTHTDLFEVSQLRDFIKNKIKNETDTLPDFMSTTQPSPATVSKKLLFFLHSPLTLEIKDSSGRVTGLAQDGTVAEDIPDSSYGEFGELKYLTVPAGDDYLLTLHGQDEGLFSLDVQESSGGVITTSSTLANLPTTANTLANLTVSDDTVSPIRIDENGDGKDMITLSLKSGEVVSYEPPTLVPEIQSPSSNGSISIPASLPAIITEPVFQDPDILGTTSAPSAQKINVGVTNVTRIAIPASHVAEKKTARMKKSREGNNAAQTAAVYIASQQPAVHKNTSAVYTILKDFWLTLKRLF